ncbi:MAG: FecR domain-containing protein [Tannerellaceae bacterium]|nr:FecR domain-containing protein [Tannerellaceae bacterium]
MLSLLQKYIENRCDECELRTLLHWLKSVEDTCGFDFVSESLWNKLENKYAYPDENRIMRLNREVDILLRKIKTEHSTLRKAKITRRKFFYRIASVVALLIVLGCGYLLINERGTADDVTYREISVARGEIKKYTLNDGTRIVLNSESKLRIPSDYNRERRQLEMTGEGFFEVAPNPHKPFTVKSGEAQVKVLGTSFNVKAYPEDNNMGITVSTGKVLVNIPEIDLQLRVMPMEHLVVNRETKALTKLVLHENNYTKWTNGTLHFQKEPLSEVLKMIKRKYGRNVILRCGNCDPLISGTHDNKSVEAVIDAICFTTKLKHREDGENIILYK